MIFGNFKLPSGRTIDQTRAGVTQLIEASFNGLDAESIQTLKAHGEIIKHPPSTTLTKQGEIGDRFYVILRGKIAATQTRDDAEVMLGILGEGKYFGELSLLGNAPRTATLVTVTDTETLELTKDAFEHIIMASPQFAHNLMIRIIGHMQREDARAIDALLLKKEELEKAYSKLRETQDELVKNERFRREFEIAADVQRDLLPETLHQIPGYQLSAYMGGLNANGNFYDVFRLGDEYSAVLIGEIGDQGVQASMFMAVIRSLFLAESRHSLSPFDITEAVHRDFLNITKRQDTFVMAIYGVLHHPSGMFSYVNAGHVKPYLARPGQPIGQLPSRGNYLGQSHTLHLEEKRVRLSPGDRLVLYSEGVVEAQNADQDPFGHTRLENIILSHVKATAEEISSAINQEIWIWQMGAERSTEFALMVLAVEQLESDFPDS